MKLFQPKKDPGSWATSNFSLSVKSLQVWPQVFAPNTAGLQFPTGTEQPVCTTMSACPIITAI